MPAYSMLLQPTQQQFLVTPNRSMNNNAMAASAVAADPLRSVRRRRASLPRRLLPLTTEDLKLPSIGYVFHVTNTPHEITTGIYSTEHVAMSLKQIRADGLEHPFTSISLTPDGALVAISVGWFLTEGAAVFPDRGIPPLVLRVSQAADKSCTLSLVVTLPHLPAPGAPPTSAKQQYYSPFLFGFASDPLFVTIPNVSDGLILHIVEQMEQALVKTVEARRAIAQEAHESLVTDVSNTVLGFLPYHRRARPQKD